jgi:hypothetical protein
VAIRQEGASINLTSVVLSVCVINCWRFVFRVLVEASSEFFLFGLRIVDNKLSVLRSAVVHGTFELIPSFSVLHLSLSLDSSLLDLTVIDEIMLIADEFSSSVRNLVELSIVGILLRGIDDALSDHLFIVPVTIVVFFLLFVLVPLVAESAVLEICITIKVPSSSWKGLRSSPNLSAVDS